MATRSRNTATKKNQRSASHSGFHFFNLYQNCPWKFFIKYYLKLVPKRTDEALINGAAFHEGKAVFYTTHSKDRALKKVKSEIKDRKHEYANEELYERSLQRIPVMLDSWIEERGWEDLEDYEILDVEREIHMEIPGTNGKIATMRIDLIVQDKVDGEILIVDTKTSSSSHKTAYNALIMSDQVTMYWWGAEAYLGKNVDGFLGDITYWHKSSTDENKILNYRGDVILRSKKDILELQDNVQNVVTEIAQKTEAVRSGMHRPSQVFPRNTYYCFAYFRPCEYAEICRRNAILKGQVPHGFRRDRDLKSRTEMAYIDDLTAGVM